MPLPLMQRFLQQAAKVLESVMMPGQSCSDAERGGLGHVLCQAWDSPLVRGCLDYELQKSVQLRMLTLAEGCKVA